MTEIYMLFNIVRYYRHYKQHLIDLKHPIWYIRSLKVRKSIFYDSVSKTLQI